MNQDITFIIISDDITVSELREQKLILFSVIVSCGTVLMKGNKTTIQANRKLDGSILHLSSHFIFKNNERSNELIKSLVSVCLFYNFPEWLSKTKYYVFNYLGCTLTKDLGLSYVNRSFGMFTEEDLRLNGPKLKTLLEKCVHGFELIILSYISSLNIFIFLRQSVQRKRSSIIENACTYLKNKTYF